MKQLQFRCLSGGQQGRREAPGEQSGTVDAQDLLEEVCQIAHHLVAYHHARLPHTMIEISLHFIPGFIAHTCNIHRMGKL